MAIVQPVTLPYKAVGVSGATKEEFVARAREIASEIAYLANETEASRKPLDSVIARMDEAGLFTMLTPKRWGGPELGLDAQLEVVEIISAACMSTGWIAAFYIGHHIFACRFSEEAQAEIFGNGPRCLLPASTAAMMMAKEVPGGWELSGKATWASGIMHADWVIVGAIAADGPRVFIIPAHELVVDDVWHVAGMAGTGSNDVIAEGVFVPTHRSELQSAFLEGTTSGAAIHANPMYRSSLMPLIYAEIIGIFSGGLEGAQTAFADQMRKRVASPVGRAAVERPQSHIQLGKSFAAVDAVRELARAIVRRSDHIAMTGDHSLSTRAQIKALTGMAVDMARREVNDMVNRGGSNSFWSERALQRFFRDINMIAIHAHWDCEIGYEQVGRLALDLPPNNPLV